MFQNACNTLRLTVEPIIMAARQRSGQVEYGIGAGMFVNDDGWFVTAAHIIDQIDSQAKDPDVTDTCLIFGRSQEGNAELNAYVDRAVDLGIGRIETTKPRPDYRFPVFRSGGAQQGELLCRAGFPFTGESLTAEWSDSKGFEFENVHPVPMFVNEALVSRFLEVPKGRGDGSIAGRWIETSSPGLTGQSGGPLADVEGRICGIQVNTCSYPLNFAGDASNEMLHVGRAVDSSTICEMLDRCGIMYMKE